MDLVNTVRKEGSRGGRGDFKWTDVQADQHRENYLGHSVMAPVGRWQKGKDLQWYSRDKNANVDENDGLTQEERAQKERQEEIARIKQAEREAMNKALGYEPASDGPLGDDNGATGANATVVTGNRAVRCEEEPDKARKHKRRDRSRSRSRERDREHRHRHRHRRDRSRSRSKDRYSERHRHQRSRSRSRDRARPRDEEDDARRRRKHHNNRDARESPRRRRRSRSSSSDRPRRTVTSKPDRSRSRSPHAKRDSQRQDRATKGHTSYHLSSRSP